MSEYGFSLEPAKVFGELRAIEADRQNAIEAANHKARVERSDYAADVADYVGLKGEKRTEFLGSVASLGRHLADIELYFDEVDRSGVEAEPVEADPDEKVEDFIGGLMIAATAEGRSILGKKKVFVMIDPDSDKNRVMEAYHYFLNQTGDV